MSTKEGTIASLSETISRRKLLRGAATLAGATTVSAILPSATPVAHAAAPSSKSMDAHVFASVNKNVVETECGKVTGSVRNGIMAYLGIPYGASTAGANRFMPPQKAAPWAGVRTALYWGWASPQVINSTLDGRRAGWAHDDESFMFEWEDEQPSEDCLRINVWTPGINDNKKRPVMFWIHGGGYTAGSANELKAYEGTNLAKRGDVVVVSINHRLGALGFMNLMDYGSQYAASANVGVMDLVAALDWVKTNISNFGGDPGNVFIFGQSGGGAKVSTLMGMPSAKGLFHRASVQSGASLRQGTHDASAAMSAAVIAELGLSKASLDKIHTVSYEAIVGAGFQVQRKQAAAGRAVMGGGWGPVVDGSIIPRNSFDPDAPSFSASVPLMVGSVLNEQGNAVQMGDATLDTIDMAESKRRIGLIAKDKTDQVVTVFQKLHPNATPFEIYSRFVGMRGRVGVVTMAERKTKQGVAPAYSYWFQKQSPVLDGRGRAFHTAELPYCFYNTERCANQTGGGPEALELAGRISDAWISFARSGNPSHPGIPKWTAFGDKGSTMILDTTCSMQDDPDGEARKLVAEITA